MKIIKTDLSSFKQDKEFYGKSDISFTIKSFELSAIRKRYLKSKKRNKSRTGSVERRSIATGGIATACMEKGKLTDYEVLAKMPEPRALDIIDNVVSFSSENKVYVIRNNQIKTIQNPWFSYIHTVDIRNNSILISSSGFDAIFDYNLNGEQQWEWFAWENGFNKGINPLNQKEIYLTRKAATAKKFEKEKADFLFIENPANQTLPTAQRAAFINSVVYDTMNPELIIATFFHEGALYSIDKKKGNIEKVLQGMVNPHGGMRFDNYYAATSTGTGELVIGDLNNQHRIQFGNLPGKPAILNKMEWIQNIKHFDGNFVAIDSNRNCFIVFNLENKVYDMIAFDSELAIQDLVIAGISENDKRLIRNLKES